MRLGACAVVLSVVANVALVQLAWAQRATGAASRLGIVIEASAPVMNLFSRAQDGIERRDWKFAIDSLQRIIEDPQWSLLPRDFSGAGDYRLYESARRRAIRQLAELPPEGLEAYRVLYDGKAKGMLARARRTHDLELLRTVTDRLLLTRHGDEAADLLASWLLDAGRYGEVVSILTDLRELVRDSDVPEARVVAKLGAAQAALGQRRSAESLLARYAESTASPLPSWFEALEDYGSAPAVSERRVGAFETTGWSWRLRGGSVRREALMPSITPTVTDTVPWSHALSARASEVWERVNRSANGEGFEFPIPNYAAWNDLLIVRDHLGCRALGLEDLRPIWSFVDDAIVNAASAGGAPEQSIMPDTGDLYENHVTAGVSIAHGLVLLVQREGFGFNWTSDEQGDAGPTGVRLNTTRGRRVRQDASRLLAIDVETGTPVWERGRTYHPEDPLGAVDIRAVPVPVGGTLWMPIIENRDLKLAVLNPEDGALIDKVTLCGMPGGGPATGVSMDLAVANGLVYVPTEFGVLFAIKVDDRTIQWAVRYGDGPLRQRASGKRRRRFVGRGSRVRRALEPVPGAWEGTPPVVAGGIVLLAPTDSRELMAFSSAFGDLVWSAEFEQAAYVIAADDQHVWLGGTSILRVSLHDGSVTWARAIEEHPTARAVLAGDSVHVPTTAGLITLSAETGAVANRQVLTDPAAPLGNLLCTDAAMFSIEPASVRKYPDTGKPYLAAMEAYEANPRDSSAALRLAWLQYLRESPQKALDTLATLGPVSELDDMRRADAVSHLRVEALLNLARGDASEAGLDKLKRAREEARTPSDRLRTCLAVADHLVESGRHLDAFESLMEAALHPEATKTVSLGDRVTASARLRIASGLLEVRQSLSDEAIGSVLDAVSTKVASSVGALGGPDGEAASQYLEAVADLPLPAPLRIRALVALSDAKKSQNAYERSEQLLLHALDLASTPAQRLSVTMRLAHLALQPTQQLAHVVDDRLERLRTEYAHLPLPPESKIAPFHDGADTVDAWVDAVRSRVAADAVVREGPAVGVSGIQYGGPVKWRVAMAGVNGRVDSQTPFERVPVILDQIFRVSGRFGPRLVELAGNSDAIGTDRAVFQTVNDAIYCQRSTDGALLWHTTLHAPETFDSLSGARSPNDATGRRRAVVDGQIGVFNARHGLFGVGLLTGRRLWFKPYDFLPRVDETHERDSLMAADDGMLAAMQRAGRLTMIRLRDGAELWQRDLRVGDVASVHLTDDAVVAVDRAGRRVQLVDRRTGALIQRLGFDQTTKTSGQVDVALMDSLLVGPDDGEEDELIDPGIVAYDTRTGRQAWRMGFLKPVAQVFDAGLGYLGVGLLGGDVVVMEIETGEVAFTHRVEGVTAVTGGRVVDTNLVVQAASPNDRRRLPMLVGLDIVTGKEAWRFENLARPAEFEKLTSRHELPVIVELPHGRAPGATIVDLRTGKRLGDAANLAVDRNRQHNFNSDYGLFDGAFVVGYSDGTWAFATEPQENEPKEGF